MGVIELVFTVIVEEIAKRLLDKTFVIGVAQRAADQHSGAIADVGGDNVLRQLRTVEVNEHGIDRVHQVFSRIDKRAIEVEDQKAQRFNRNEMRSVGHNLSLANDPRRRPKRRQRPRKRWRAATWLTTH